MTNTTIYINTLPVHAKSGGIKTFLMELMHAFAKRETVLFDYCIICSKLTEDLFRDFQAYKNFRIQVLDVNNLNPVKRIYYEQFRLPGILNKKKNSILLNICNIAIVKCRTPQVTIIQAQLSIAAFRKLIPDEYVSTGLLHKMYYDLLLKKSIEISQKTIAVSYYMLDFLKDYKKKIVVIHEGVNLKAFSGKITNEHAFGNYKPYILCVSTLFPHKNMDKLIQAYAVFSKQSATEYKLIIAGKDPDGRQLKKLKQVSAQNGVSDNVIFLNWVETDKIAALYKNASLFVFLSSMEFFGLPVLEAMASEVPVISSNKMSLPEVANNSAILVEPDDINIIAKEMHTVLYGDGIKDKLIDKGLENIKKFKWSTTANKFENIFSDINKIYSKSTL
jgi:glycosyltransferase involved in cell wall biosynthesis